MAPPAARTSGRAWPLIGRDAELMLLSASMDDPACGGVALAGPAGAGKTRLAREVNELASLRGLATVAVRATKSSADMPLVALAPLFAKLGVDPATAESPALAMAAAVARLTGGGIGQDTIGEDAAVTASAPTTTKPGHARIVLVIDDIQDLDDTSMALVDHLVNAGGIFVVMTVRHGEMRPRGLHDLWTDGRIVRIEIEPLTAPHVGALVGAVLGGPVDGAALQALTSQSGGNVLFLRELVARCPRIRCAELAPGNLAARRLPCRITQTARPHRRALPRAVETRAGSA